MKTVFWGLRVSEALNVRAIEEATQRGMNLSEFIRYALHLFFDQIDDSKPHPEDCAPTILVDKEASHV